jgi:hypothetical protein
MLGKMTQKKVMTDASHTGWQNTHTHTQKKKQSIYNISIRTHTSQVRPYLRTGKGYRQNKSSFLQCYLCDFITKNVSYVNMPV